MKGPTRPESAAKVVAARLECRPCLQRGSTSAGPDVEEMPFARMVSWLQHCRNVRLANRGWTRCRQRIGLPGGFCMSRAAPRMGVAVTRAEACAQDDLGDLNPADNPRRDAVTIEPVPLRTDEDQVLGSARPMASSAALAPSVVRAGMVTTLPTSAQNL